jgi:Arc/MetJ-type ribon-helix-helix transcriptional regulator
MPGSNGDSPLDRINETLRLLLESHQANWAEHERLWTAVQALRDSQLETHRDVQSLVQAIRSLIDRIPPENLRAP